MDRKQLIRDIHEASHRFAFAVTGGGSAALSDLLSVPGASNTVVECSVPYSERALEDYLGRLPESAASATTARQLAMRAWQRAVGFAGTGDDPVSADNPSVFGLGATSALSTNRTRRGADRCHIAIQGSMGTWETNVDLTHQDRASQERVVADLILNHVAERCGIPVAGPRPENSPDNSQIEQRALQASQIWSELMTGVRDHSANSSQSRVLFPGAFNPIHHGHEEMARYATHLLSRPVTLEISVYNVDKPPIDYLEMSDRLRGVTFPVVFTRAPTFVEKARLFPGSTFIVGADTMIRIVDSRYYGHSATHRDAALQEMVDLNTRFLVFGRTLGEHFHTLDELTLPAILKPLVTGVDQKAFRRDVSSSEIRQEYTGIIR